MAEALVGGAFLSASLQVLFDRLASREFINFFSKQKIDDGLIGKMETNLLALKVLLDDAEDKQITNSAVKAWLDKLQHVVYQADDLLDEISTKALRIKLEADDLPQNQRSRSKVSLSRFFLLMKRFLLRINCFASTPAYLSDKAIESKMKEVISKLEEFVNQNNSLNLTANVVRQQWQGQETSSVVVESDIYGRNVEKEKIMELLLSENATRNQISVIPIVGMGGMGKTTLAQLLYNDDRVNEKFHHMKAWVCVSDPFDTYMITKRIFDDLTGSNADIKSLNQLQIKLKETLAGKKFLIVLDDVWNHNYNEWDCLLKPFSAGAPESRIIVTTRIDLVAFRMGTVPNHYLEQLSFEDCWSLFAKHAFGSGDYMAPSDFESIGKQIVEKCEGLPLAVKSLGGLLRSKQDIQDWKNILKSKIWGLKERDILPALRLSYQYLPSHLKRCFAFCSIFPKDYKFEKEKLIQLWIAVDLVQQPNMLLEDIGKDYFHELLSMSFFQRLSHDSGSGFVMHALIHDLAQQISGEFCFMLEDAKPLNRNCEKVCHFSYVQGEYDASEKFKDVNEVECLRTFISFSRNKQSSFLGNKVLIDMLPSLKCLRVLSLSQYQISELPKSIGNLIHLRYLDLSWTKIKRLPDSITTLCNLQTLDLSYCENLTELPVNMGKLINLRHLDIRETKLTEMPEQMSRLKDLQHLTYFVVGKDGGSKISGLKELCQLRGQLSILGLKNVTSSLDASEANLKGMEHLEGLELEWGGDANDSEKEKDVLDQLQAHVGVKDLRIINYGGTRFPDWLERAHLFHDMVSLDLIDCANCSYLPPIGQLPSLKNLRIEGMEAIRKVGQEFYGNASSSIKPFRYLEKLSFKRMSEWEEWHSSGVGEFSCLLEFSLVDCPKLTSELSIRFPSLTKLEISKCQRLAINQVRLLLQGLPSIQELKISEMTNLTELPHQLQHLSSLKNLEISDIPNLTELPQQLQHMSSLQKLEISCMPDLKELPQELCKLVNLERLKIEQCPRLASFPDVGLPPMLKTLEIERCEALRSLVAVPSEKIVNMMRMSNCSYLQASFPIAALTTLSIADCGRLEFSLSEEMEGHNYHTSIEDLSLIESCDHLKSLSLGFFPKLRSLNILGCKNLETFLIPNELQYLMYLYISDCENLKSLPQRMHTHLPSLESLTIEKCSEVESFPDDGLPSNLTTLVIYKCEKLMKGRIGWDLQTLPSLETFSISGEYKEEVLESFPEECLLPTTLTSLTIVNLQNLKSLNHKGLQHLTSLKTLSISYCPKLRSLPEEGLPNSLSFLQIRKCPLLKQRFQREKGKYWPNISRIRHIRIDGEDIVNLE